MSRFRTADDLERIVRANAEIGVNRFFLTDDNLARNRNWEACFDRLIELREKHGIRVYLQVQVDTLCHRIPGFIEKGVKAGIDNVFVGMENINPDNLAAVKKTQNRLLEYREMFLAWKKHPVVITAGYIIGFPNDTRESILRDVDTDEARAADRPDLFHQSDAAAGLRGPSAHARDGTWMDPDLNKYDLNHRVTHHQKMSDEEWDQRLRRGLAPLLFVRSHRDDLQADAGAALEQAPDHAAPAALVSRLPSPLRLPSARRRPRPPEIPPRPPLRHEAREPAGVLSEILVRREVRNISAMVWTYRRMKKMLDAIWADPAAANYTDIAITAPGVDELSLGIYETRGTAEAIEKQKRQTTSSRPRNPRRTGWKR